ncbi:MAG: FAD-dependent oxidoreductase [Bacteroidales bacterium]|nr:FAD-dependent oxidoreductase [Bacteroidales bacterium]
MNSKKRLMRSFFIAISLLILFSLSSFNQSLLVEAENFKEKGGWLVDPQFVQQMGSPYLLAHGLGIPVKNAITELSFENPGTYTVWVRTMNWSPGNWSAPGRFKIRINGLELNSELGIDTGWKWQEAGSLKIKKGISRIELLDLTGFDGRCDAIFFSSQNRKPPDNNSELALWRKQQLNEKVNPEHIENFDLVIVGGGIAGCAASIAAAEQGLTVALIHDRPVLGGNASSEIRVHTEGIPWNSERIISMINTKWWPNGSPDSKLDDEKRHRNIEKYENIALFLNWRAFSANSVNNQIKAVDAKHTSTGETMRFSAPVFIDCTGDGWIGFWAGAEYMYGREEAKKFDESWEKYGELWSPTQADNKVMGASVLWRSTRLSEPAQFPEVPWAIEVASDYAASKGTWNWEYSNNDLHQISDAEKIRDHMLKAIYGSFYNTKQNPGNENLQLEWVSYLVGKRESRRLVGDYIYTFNDVREMREFQDAVVKETRPVDVHYQQHLLDSIKPDFLSEALYYKVDYYYLPFRSLYSKNISNLLMAGRCFSCSHIGLGGPRVMHTTGQMGVATGYAAFLCKKYNTDPRGVYTDHIIELQELIEKGYKNYP